MRLFGYIIPGEANYNYTQAISFYVQYLKDVYEKKLVKNVQ